MATYNLRRFSHAEGLKAIAREHLLALLNPHKPYFDGRGLTLPPPSAWSSSGSGRSSGRKGQRSRP